MNPKINLISVIGYVPEIFVHFYNHYKNIVDEFYIIVHQYDDNTDVYESVVKCGITPYKIINSEKCNFYDISSTLNEIIKSKPDEWWIVADADEFHLYPDEIYTILNECDNKGYKVVPGILLDRVGKNGSFPKITDEDIWKTFPECGYFRSPTTNACPFKSCIVKGDVELEAGQHFPTINGKEITNNFFRNNQYVYPIKNGVVQVHHFKWDNDIFERLKMLIDIKKEYTFWEENLRMFNFLTENGIDVNNKKFYFQSSVYQFSEYKFWNKLVNKLI